LMEFGLGSRPRKLLTPMAKSSGRRVFPTLVKRGLFSIGEVARLFDISVQGVHRWLRNGRIKGYARTSKRGKYQIPKGEVVRLLKLAQREIPGLWSPSGNVKKRALLIDDYRPIRMLVEKAFEQPKFRIQMRTAANIMDGLLLISTFEPHVVLLDYFHARDRVEGDLALAFIRKIKQQIRSIKVIGITAHAGVGPKMLKAGADAFLEKPFSLEELKNVLFSQLFSERRGKERRLALEGIIMDR
jgi:CheY-like chemotaxis protein